MVSVVLTEDRVIDEGWISDQAFVGSDSLSSPSNQNLQTGWTPSMDINKVYTLMAKRHQLPIIIWMMQKQQGVSAVIVIFDNNTLFIISMCCNQLTRSICTYHTHIPIVFIICDGWYCVKHDDV